MDNFVGTNTDSIKCCEGEDVELVVIDHVYKARFECKKCKSIKTRQLHRQAMEMRFSNLRCRCMNEDHFRLFFARVYIHMNTWTVLLSLKR